MQNNKNDFLTNFIAYFVNSKITPLLILASILIGLFAVIKLPREEEPQISVPMFDIFVHYPGASAEEVERRIINVGERVLWEISGVEYIYSTAECDKAMFIVRFKVGENVEKSLIKLYTKVYSNLDQLPKGSSQPLIKIRSIDDVPILALTFYSKERNAMALRKIVAQIQTLISAIPDVSQTTITGGRKRQFQIFVDEGKLKERMLTACEISELVQKANVKKNAGYLSTVPQVINVTADAFFKSKQDLEELVVGVSHGDVVRLKDVAVIVDGPDEEDRDVFVRFSETPDEKDKGPFQAVTLAVSKRKGANATYLCNVILNRMEEFKKSIIPSDVKFIVTRDYGETASEKSNELLFHMAIAVVGVSILIAFSLGLMESGVVAIAIPVTLALTLAAFYFLGFTLNRITLFALIFSIGILVDDPIVCVENIVRHLKLPENKNRDFIDVTISAVKEVGSPLILATLAVISAILPMAFVSGLMGPYMRPIPIGSSSAMIFSMLVSFIVTPWAAYRILGYAHRRNQLKHHNEHKEDLLTRIYRWYMKPLIYSKKIRYTFIVSLVILLALAVALVPLKLVRLKMLPFDNKNEFQVILNMPEGTHIQKTIDALNEMADYLIKVPEVKDIQIYAGCSAPYNFNGLVRHYFLRDRTHQGDIQVNLLHKNERKRQSHDIAAAVRPALHQIAKKYNAKLQVAEVPPGPPVLSTLVLEIYGPDHKTRDAVANQVENILLNTEGITDVDTYVAKDEKLLKLLIDTKKATLNGIPVNSIAEVIAMVVHGKAIDIAHIPEEYEPVEIVMRFPKEKRANIEEILNIHFLSKFGQRIPLRDLIQEEHSYKDKPIYHKNLMPVSYVIADVGGEFESPVYAILALKDKIENIPLPGTITNKQDKLEQLFTHQPHSAEIWGMKWDGEWHVTYEVFRDLGIAFAAVLVLIYVLVVGWFQSFKIPWIIMLPIPLTLVGILPAHWMFNVFFTATSMIGMIAGAGIVVRNSIILVDFIELRLKEGMSLEEAVIDAGAKRFRPMLLTATAVIVGSAVILFDPIFQGLALALMAGEIASTILSRTAIPVIYYMANKKQ